MKEPRDIDGVLLTLGNLVIGTHLIGGASIGVSGEVVALVRTNVIEVRDRDGVVHRSAAFLWRKAETLTVGTPSGSTDSTVRDYVTEYLQAFGEVARLVANGVDVPESLWKQIADTWAAMSPTEREDVEKRTRRDAP